MGYREHAIREFEYAGWLKDGVWCDEMQEMICNQVLELLDLFSEHGHSGSSAPYAINLFTKLAKFEPIGVIKGTDDEWQDISEDVGGESMFQNKRLSSVFKNGKEGKPYFIDAIIWKDEGGVCFTGNVDEVSSSGEIKEFPFSPKRFYIDVVEEEEDYVIKDKSQLEQVKEIYNLSA